MLSAEQIAMAFTYGYQAEMKHFVECVRNRRRPRESYEDGYIVNCILDAGYRSMRERAWTAVDYLSPPGYSDLEL